MDLFEKGLLTIVAISIATAGTLTVVASRDVPGYSIERSQHGYEIACVKTIPWADNQVMKVCSSFDDCNKFCHELSSGEKK